MANPEHLKKLMEGVEAWNKWRPESLYIAPHSILAYNIPADLSGADLSKADLSKANLSKADLSGVNLRGADLRDSDLRNTNLYGASLFWADLRGTRLHRADLRKADLSGAYLDGAELNGADLGGAILNNVVLKNADFSDVKMEYTIISSVDLSEVKNLENVRHYRRSILTIDTIYESRGHIPDLFMRGCGVPDDFITYVRSLEGQLKFFSCFISYSSKDVEFANHIYNDLQCEGVRCWFAPEDLKTGEKFHDRIHESIRLHDRLLLVLSENSVASQWVGNEVQTALEMEREQKKIVLFPVRLDDAVASVRTGWPADVRLQRYITDFTNWRDPDSYKKAFSRLLRDLKAES
jgi:TIR domain/Pentapeptide repeats (8 copies)